MSFVNCMSMAILHNASHVLSGYRRYYTTRRMYCLGTDATTQRVECTVSLPTILHNASNVLSGYRRYYTTHRMYCLGTDDTTIDSFCHIKVENHDCDEEPTCEYLQLRRCRLPPSSHHNTLYHRALPSTAPQNLVSDQHNVSPCTIQPLRGRRRTMLHRATSPCAALHSIARLRINLYYSVPPNIILQHSSS